VSVQLAVAYFDAQTRYFPVSAHHGWRIDAMSRCLVIGRGLPRTYVPLDRVESFTVERNLPTSTEARPCQQPS